LPVFLAAALAFGATNAQDTITFYGELTNQATDIPVTGNLDVFVRVFSSPNGGSALWDECWEDIAVDQGRVSLHLGAVNPFQAALGISLGEFLAQNPKIFAEIQVCDARTACGGSDESDGNGEATELVIETPAPTGDADAITWAIRAAW